MIYEAGMTSNRIGDDWKDITFKSTFPDLPFFIATMQTTEDGGDVAAVWIQNMSLTKTQIKIEEENSNDTEVSHTSEIIDYLAIGNKTTGTTPSQTPPPADNQGPQTNVSTALPWTLHYTDSQETVGRRRSNYKCSLDGDPRIIWHTAWSSSTPSCPHEIQVNLGGPYAVSGQRYRPRQGGGINGTVANMPYMSAPMVKPGAAR